MAIEDIGLADPRAMTRAAICLAMKEWGYGAGYQHAHQFEDALPEMKRMPERLVGRRFYEPVHCGLEQKIAERLAELRKRRERRGGVSWRVRYADQRRGSGTPWRLAAKGMTSVPV